MVREIQVNDCRMLQGDVIEGLRTLPDESVQCCVTSPPYWNLRDYKADGQIGNEETPDEYVEKMVEVFAGVKRMLRDDGVLFVNLGDSYTSGGRQGHGTRVGNKQETNRGANGKIKRVDAGLKDGNLVGIPWRVAFALQADGWILRQDIVWHKASPMPESVQNRCTKAHEYIFLFAKKSGYYYDAEAIKEKTENGWVWHTQPFKCGDKQIHHKKSTPQSTGEPSDRNKRSVWTIPTQPGVSGHYAAFPILLPTLCIKAGTSQKGCCPQCGTPWERRTKKVKKKRERPNDLTKRKGEAGTGNFCPNTVAGISVETVGWEPGCDCDADKSCPCVVLDPFAGSFTTNLAAQRLGRHSIGIELNPDYIEKGRRRLLSRGSDRSEVSKKKLKGFDL